MFRLLGEINIAAYSLVKKTALRTTSWIMSTISNVMVVTAIMMMGNVLHFSHWQFYIF